MLRKVTRQILPNRNLEAIASINAEGDHLEADACTSLQDEWFHQKEGNGRARTNAYIAGSAEDVGMDIFNRGLCLPSDNKMTEEQQDRIIEVIKACFE